MGGRSNNDTKCLVSLQIHMSIVDPYTTIIATIINVYLIKWLFFK